eukprot:Nitzschia sp. Nitz4//scaffold311_size21207//14707//15861//NITZ4_008624-RA/size21207-processed-gene-0.53-mRNA-1//-1//CDS//3329547392//7277//frame0
MSDEASGAATASAAKPNLLGATAAHGYSEDKLLTTKPSVFPSPLSTPWRIASAGLAWLVPSLFYLGPLSLLAPPLLASRGHTRAAGTWLVLNLLAMFAPLSVYPHLYRWFQLWYEPFQLKHNLKDLEMANERGREALWICAMHPHGVIPIHAFLWGALSDQILPDTCGRAATTEAAMTVPLLRQLLGWLGGVSASRPVLQKHLSQGHNVFLLPGGVKEIFLSRRGDDVQSIYAKSRRGLIKLALQNGAYLLPMYAFGATDLHHQLATYGQRHQASKNLKSSTSGLGQVQERLSRWFRAGFTFFWGLGGSPMPFFVPMTIVLGDPLVPNSELIQGEHGKRVAKPIPNPTEEQIDELMDRYLDALQRLFDQYKEEAGYPDAILDIR